MEIQKKPVNRQGKTVEPVVWEPGCLEEVCGSCSMLINGRPRQACTALIELIIRETGSSTITLAPFTKFPLVRDLIVDRTSMFENLKKVHGWIEVDGTYDPRPGRRSARSQEVTYSLSTCMTCGCCVEACPQVNARSKFMGPQIISAGAPFQFASHRQESKSPSVKHADGRGRNQRLRQRSKLRQGLPKANPLDRLHRRDRPRCHRASFQRALQLS